MTNETIKCLHCQSKDTTYTGTRNHQTQNERGGGRVFRCNNPECNNPDPKKIFTVAPVA